MYELRIYPTTREHPPYMHASYSRAGVLIHKYRYAMYAQQTLCIYLYCYTCTYNNHQSVSNGTKQLSSQAHVPLDYLNGLTLKVYISNKMFEMIQFLQPRKIACIHKANNKE